VAPAVGQGSAAGPALDDELDALWLRRHAGMTGDPHATLDRLFASLVA